MKETIASWESQLRSVLRIILAFTFSLHGYRLMYGFFSVTTGRSRRFGMALDSLPHMAGLLIIIAGVLLFLGLFTRITALVLCVLTAAAYFTAAAPRGPWPIRNGGEETIAYFFLFFYFMVAGAGVWSLDELVHKRRHTAADFTAAGAPARP
jgi:putative oxidoreductase